MKVTLREKKKKNGDISLYLDFYPPIIHPETGKPTRREFLKLYLISKSKGQADKEQNKETKILAEHLRARRQIDIQNGHYEFLNRKDNNVDFIKYFEQLAEKRKESKNNYANWISTLKYIQNFSGNKPILTNSLSRHVCEDFKDYLNTAKTIRSEKKKLAQNSKHSYFNKFIAALKRAYKDGIIKENIAQTITPFPAGETKREYLSLEELQLLAKTECDNDLLKRAALFSAITGMRWSDVVKLTWADVRHSKTENCYKAVFRQQKTKAMEWNPISEEAVALLGTKGEPNDVIFKGLVYSAYITVSLSRWLIKAGVTKYITFHNFRHTYATLQLTLGTDISVIQKMLGHKHLKTTQIYAKVIDERKVETTMKINLGLEPNTNDDRK